MQFMVISVIEALFDTILNIIYGIADYILINFGMFLLIILGTALFLFLFYNFLREISKNIIQNYYKKRLAKWENKNISNKALKGNKKHFFNILRDKYILEIWGDMGSGKTSLGGAISFYFVNETKEHFNNNQLYYKIKAPSFITLVKKIEGKYEPWLYVNKEFQLSILNNEGKPGNDSYRAIEQDVRILPGGSVIFVDEHKRKWPKEMHKQKLGAKDKATIDTFISARQFGAKIILTGHRPGDYWAQLRASGSFEIQQIGHKYYLPIVKSGYLHLICKINQLFMGLPGVFYYKIFKDPSLLHIYFDNKSYFGKWRKINNIYRAYVLAGGRYFILNFKKNERYGFDSEYLGKKYAKKWNGMEKRKPNPLIDTDAVK